MSKELEFLIIHCTDTPEGREVTGTDIRLWHLSPVSKGGRGWKQVGYTDIVHLGGKIENLVPNNNDNIVDPWEITNGVLGKNSVARHIVYAGGKGKDGKPKDTRTIAQKEALKKFVLDFVKKHPKVKIAGHYHFAAKACPSFDVEKWCVEIGVPSVNIYKK